jgi:hypothetical protein
VGVGELAPAVQGGGEDWAAGVVVPAAPVPGAQGRPWARVVGAGELGAHADRAADDSGHAGQGESDDSDHGDTSGTVR